MTAFLHDQLRFHYLDTGTSGTSEVPFFFQHGLGGDVGQPSGLFSPPPGIRLLCFDCRAHGETTPVGDPGKLRIAVFADDLRALMDRLEIPDAVIGGISMGAAVALNFALRFPERTRGLVLSRPAWLAGPMEENARIYAAIAKLTREHGAARGREAFAETEDYRKTLRLSPDAAASLLGQFDNPRAEETVAKLERIPTDSPVDRLEAVEAIGAPTLVLANRQDPIHPFEYGEVLARRISGAEFREITPKSLSRERHMADVQAALEAFLARFLARQPVNGLPNHGNTGH